ncbi:MAG: IS4 family transposase [Gammaproteobacteria bacterium]
MSWAAAEVAAGWMPDQRLKRRLTLVLEQLSERPTQSIPAACVEWSQTKAAYRLLSNERIGAVEILDGHARATLQRISAEPIVLMLQDTTFLEYLKDHCRHGFGTLRRTVKDEYLLHPSVAFTPERVNLGVLGHHFWQRPEQAVGHLRAQRPIEAKESYRWLLGYELACAVQRLYPETLVVNIADREGDIHEWFLDSATRLEAERAVYLIRAKCNRRVAAAPQDTYLWERLRGAAVLGQLEIEVPRQPGRHARTAQLTVRVQTVTFNRARRLGGQLPPVTVTALHVNEDQPPQGAAALEWMLLTNLVVEDFAAAETLIGWYRARWEIELYFRILKQGCQIEELRLETPERLEKCIAIYLIVAWRIHHITQAARAQPQAACTQVFSAQEWQTIYLLQQRQRPPPKPPTLRTVTRMLAQLGGFLARKGDGEPGAETLWRGYRVLQQALDTLEIASAVRR